MTKTASAIGLAEDCDVVFEGQGGQAGLSIATGDLANDYLYKDLVFGGVGISHIVIGPDE